MSNNDDFELVDIYHFNEKTLAVFQSFSIIGIIVGLVVLLLIYDMRRWNGFIKLVTILTVCQMLYDVGLVLFSSQGRYLVYSGSAYMCSQFFTIFFGVFSMLVTNCMSYAIAYVALTGRHFNIDSQLTRMLVVIVLMSLVPTVLFLVADASFAPSSQHRFTTAQVLEIYHIYLGTRLSSASFNTIVLLGLLCLLYCRGLVTLQQIFCCCSCDLGNSDLVLATSNQGNENNNNNNDNNENKSMSSKKNTSPLAELTKRFVIYPICQTLAIVPFMVYNFVYIFPDNLQGRGIRASFGLAACTVPSAGLGYAVAFLIVTPNAYRHLVCRLTNKPVPSPSLANAQLVKEVRDSFEADNNHGDSLSSFSSRPTEGGTGGGRSSGVSSFSLAPSAPRLSMLFDRLSQLDEDDLAMLVEREGALRRRNNAARIATESGEAHNPIAKIEL